MGGYRPCGWEFGDGRIGGRGGGRGMCRGCCGGRNIVVVVELVVASRECGAGFDVFLKGEIGRS